MIYSANIHSPIRSHLCAVLVIAFCGLFVGGCNVLGVLAYKTMPAPRVDAAYAGLAGQTVGVMVWTTPGTRMDYERLQLDTAMLMHAKLERAASESKELKGTTFPVQPASIYRYQVEHPQIEGFPITDIAPKFGVSRLIYIEIYNFSTHSEISAELRKGNMSGTLKVIEIKDGKATVAYESGDMSALYPRTGPAEGSPNLNPGVVYRGTVNEFTDALARLFVNHEAPE